MAGQSYSRSVLRVSRHCSCNRGARENDSMSRRVLLVFALLTCASPVFAQQYKNARRLGGPAAFYRPPLTDAASLARMARTPAIANDIRTVMQAAGMSEVADAFISAMSA